MSRVEWWFLVEGVLLLAFFAVLIVVADFSEVPDDDTPE